MSIDRKLERDIVPYMVTAEGLKRLGYFRLHSAFVWLGLGLAVLSSLGIGAESFNGFDKLIPDTAGGQVSDGKVDIFAASGVISMLLAVVVIGRAIHEHLRAGQRAILAKNAMLKFRIWANDLNSILAEADPMPRLNELQKQIATLVAEGVKDEWWPWEGPGPNDDIGEKVKLKMQRLREKFGDGWPPSPPPPAVAASLAVIPQQRLPAPIPENAP